MTTSAANNLTDAELLERYYADGDSDWLGTLMQRYTLLLFGVCMKYLKQEEEAKDAVQQIFLKAVAEIQKYQITYFKSWLYTVARNYCLMQLRNKEKSTVPVTDKILASNPEENHNTLYHHEKEATFSALKEALELLNPEQQRCIVLFYLQKKSYNEIATITGYTAMQIKSNIQNGKRNIKINMEKKMKQHEA